MVLYGPTRKTPKKLIILGTNINWSSNAKYLGVTIDKRLTLNSHIQNTIQKAKCARAALYPLINNHSPIPITVRLTIFKIYLKPLLTYASPAWSPLISKSNWTKIEAVQNIALRSITGAHYLTHNIILLSNTNTNTIQTEIQRTCKAFLYRTNISKFPHLQKLQLPTKISR